MKTNIARRDKALKLQLQIVLGGKMIILFSLLQLFAIDPNLSTHNDGAQVPGIFNSNNEFIYPSDPENEKLSDEQRDSLKIIAILMEKIHYAEEQEGMTKDAALYEIAKSIVWLDSNMNNNELLVSLKEKFQDKFKIPYHQALDGSLFETREELVETNKKNPTKDDKANIGGL